MPSTSSSSSERSFKDEENGRAHSTPDSDLIDHETFDQLLEMDDDEDHDFSKSIVWNYFEQAETTFDSMDNALEKRNLEELSNLGHFLKGSSAAIGLTKVKASCEKMQHFGHMKDETGINAISEEDAFTKISTLLERVKDEYKEAETYLKNFYTERDNS